VGYHYGRPGIIDDHTAIMPEDVREQRLPEGWIPPARMGARNSVFHQAESLIAGARLPFQYGALFAQGRIPIWRPAAPGEALSFRVPVPSDGEYRVHFVARLDAAGGRARVMWDGEPALSTETSSVDLHRPHRILLRNFTLPTRQLTVGTHTLELLFDGAPEWVQRPEIGIDFVWVQEVG
jgi:hypothetical protein